LQTRVVYEVGVQAARVAAAIHSLRAIVA